MGRNALVNRFALVRRFPVDVGFMHCPELLAPCRMRRPPIKSGDIGMAQILEVPAHIVERLSVQLFMLLALADTPLHVFGKIDDAVGDKRVFPLAGTFLVERDEVFRFGDFCEARGV